MPLRIAAKIDPLDQPYFDEVIAPLLNDPLVEFVGEVNEAQKDEFLGNAAALLFPIDWPEPFGLVMIEALACGTPVIAYPHGSVPEILNHGETGFLVTSIDEAVAAVDEIPSIDRARCRAVFEERFSVERMAQDYLRLYSGLAEIPVSEGTAWLDVGPGVSESAGVLVPSAGLPTDRLSHGPLRSRSGYQPAPLD
jgi:glycosyltransferase involved in cell wall biosynthesis